MKYNFLIIVLITVIACKRSYEPAVLSAPNNYLVVDGVIRNSIDSPTTVLLSRTKNLTDTIINTAEAHAQVYIESDGGQKFNLTENKPGAYTIAKLQLNTAAKYRLHITTANGREYLSDYVPVNFTSPIDSLNFEQKDDVTVFVNTHNPTGNTRYYQWDYTETWQYTSKIQGSFGVANGLIYYLDSTTQLYNCWKNNNSNDILISSSVALSEDKISHFPVCIVPKNSEKIGIRYSILVKQYALTQQAYKYWQTLKKNTQQLGSLFDAQPAELSGNIHCVQNANEPVIGYISVSNVEQKRLFINNSQLNNWKPAPSDLPCEISGIAQDPNNFLIYNYPDPSFIPIYFTSGGGIAITKRVCVDCTMQGGINKKPVFW